jgi:uncharacterized protein (DUF2336 family)
MDTLSAKDISHLLEPGAQVEAKSELSSKIMELLNGATLTASELEIAKDIIKKLATDIEVAVRQAISEQIASSPYLDDDVAHTLARDVESVALPILMEAPRLADKLLIDILRQPSSLKAVAIAGRANITSDVVDAILDTANLRAIVRVVENKTADFSEASYNNLLDQYGQLSVVQEPLAERAALPGGILDRLVLMVSDSLREVIVEKHHLDRKTVEQIISRGREVAMVQLLRRVNRRGEDSSVLARQLMARGRLSGSLIFLALAAGDLDFYFASVGALARISQDNAKVLAFDGGGVGLLRLLEQARIPGRIRPLFVAAMDVLTDRGGVVGDLYRYQADVISSAFRRCSQLGDSDIDQLLCTVLTAGRNQDQDPWDVLEISAA